MYNNITNLYLQRIMTELHYYIEFTLNDISEYSINKFIFDLVLLTV